VSFGISFSTKRKTSLAPKLKSKRPQQQQHANKQTTTPTKPRCFRLVTAAAWISTISTMESNPHALDSAQDPNEVFEIFEPPPANFDPYASTPISTASFTTRDVCHKQGLWHCSVHIWIVDTASSSILLQKRSMKKDTFPGRVSHHVARYRIQDISNHKL